MPICPNCKDGVNFTQTRQKTFRCRSCGLKIGITEDFKTIYVTLNGKEWRYPRDGWFERK